MGAFFTRSFWTSNPRISKTIESPGFSKHCRLHNLGGKYTAEFDHTLFLNILRVQLQIYHFRNLGLIKENMNVLMVGV